MITKALLYCTKNQPALFYSVLDRKYMIGKDKPNDRFPNRLNGKVVAVCDIEVEEIEWLDSNYCSSDTGYCTDELSPCDLERKSCLTTEQLKKYLWKNDKGYAIHIKNLKVFDEPHELHKTFEIGDVNISLPYKAPQNMQKCWAFEIMNGIVIPVSDYALISIQPQWLVKILNGEKTIEVRKKVLKEML